MSLYGPHFTKALCEFAVNNMYKVTGKIKPFTKQEVDDKLKSQNVQLQYNKLHDAIYVANMCRADFLGSSIPDDDRHLCLYIKDVIDDPDGYDGQVFYRWLSDIEGLGIIIDWEDYI